MCVFVCARSERHEGRKKWKEKIEGRINDKDKMDGEVWSWGRGGTRERLHGKNVETQVKKGGLKLS